MKYFIKYLFIISALVLIFPAGLLAASFSIDGPEQTISDTLFKVDIFVNAPDTEINAVSGSITYSGDKLSLEDVKSGGSLISLWLEEPTLEQSFNGQLKFSGLIPGGYSGDKGYLFSLIFKTIGASDNEKVAINLLTPTVLLNNGEGTELKTLSVSKILNVINKVENNEIIKSQAGRALVYQESPDRFPPEKFTPLIYNNRDKNGSNLYLAFLSEDKQSGISHYELAKSKTLTNNYQRLAWTKVNSPHIIKASDTKQFIYLKAVDKQGNFQVAIINPTLEETKSQILKIILIAGQILVSIGLIIFSLKFFRNKNKF